ncbi:MAG: PfkB family carbohydrate kinase [Candidatus Limnocylindrales bacterium]
MTPQRQPRVVAFGELMLRLNPRGHERLVQASEFEVRFTGAEANAAAMLAGLGVRASCVSRVPDTEIGQACINYLRRFGIETSGIARGGDRLGLFYLETGASQRASKVIYDRDNSALRSAEPDEFDWPALLADADWLHFSGTAPALGDRVRTILRDALGHARSIGVTVSCDLNYRAKLWSPAEARRVMTELMPSVDVLIGNEEDAEKVFGIRAAGSDVVKGNLVLSSYEQVSSELARRFNLRYVATTLRTSVSASLNHWAGMLYDGDVHVSRSYEIHPIVDRVGGGDSFSAGLIYGLLTGWDSQRCVEFAAAASCLKHSIAGDFNLVSLQEVETLLGGDASGRVVR